ncbi:ribulose-phosphate 3-epimerase [Aerococcaceae bacterium WGS1372]
MTMILPSLFGANILELGDELKRLEAEQTQILHVDMMDGNFVSNIAFGPNQIKALKEQTSMIFDVHMMVANPLDHIDDVIDTGSEMISVHIESTPHIHLVIQKIKAAGRKAGVVINPATPINSLEYLLDDIDYVLVMTINPGQPGQRFIEKSYQKISDIKTLIADRNIQIEVDGGINNVIAEKCKKAGADLIVVGGYLFNGNLSENYTKLNESIR